MTTDLKSVLLERGAKIGGETPEWIRCNRFWLNGSNNRVGASINKRTGRVVDFVSSRRYNIKDLLKGINLSFEKEEKEEETIDMPKAFNKEDYLFFPNYSYFEKRGVSKETLQVFDGGLIQQGKMYQRFTFPIYDKSGKKMIGLNGRDVLDKENRPKWLINGPRRHFLYPSHVTLPFIKETRQVVLLEGSDFLFAYEAGIRNFLVCFGSSMSPTITNFLLSIDNLEVVLCMNNDEPGKEAAKKIKGKLDKLLECVRVVFPRKKDLGEQTKQENRIWAKKNGIKVYD